MRRSLRANLPCALIAAAGAATLGWLGLYGFAWNDYEVEAQPALDALVHGHLVEFLRLAPAYGGSLLERAPFALLPSVWHGGALAVYRMAALPCLLAAAALGVWLLAGMRAQGAPRLARALALGICVANPITLRALEIGHPEELLGACLCLAAVLLAAAPQIARRRALLAGVLLGLAIANKEWALLAVGPVLLALPAGARLPCLGCAAIVAGALLAPFALVESGGFLTATRTAAGAPSTIFQPWQLWWFFGHHGALVHGVFGAPKPGYRIGPAWAGAVSHPAILAVGVVLSAALWLRSRRSAPGSEADAKLRAWSWRASRARTDTPRLGEQAALLALALLLLLRCMLDTWDNVYYLLPFVLALLTWEVRTTPARPPALALVATALVWISFQELPGHVSPDAQAALFTAWSLPLATLLARRLLLACPTPGRQSRRPRSEAAIPAAGAVAGAGG